MITAGMDFAFQHAEINFKFLENVTEAFSAAKLGKKFKFFYSTVDEYFSSLKIQQR